MNITEWPEIIAGMVSDGEPVKILVCGGRTYADKDRVFRTLDKLAGVDEVNQLGHNLTIIHGGAKGADHLAGQWAVCNWKEERVFKADWNRYGRDAGLIRNEKMLKEGQPNLVVAFPGGPGTAHMVQLARMAGIPIMEIK